MKVYVITSGEYSSYHINGVSLDKHKAEEICATLNDNMFLNNYSEIEEYDTDEIKVNTNNAIKTRFDMVIDKNTGFQIYFQSGFLVTKDVNEISVTADGSIEIIATLPRETTDEEAKKIMLDRIAEFKAERANI